MSLVYSGYQMISGIERSYERMEKSSTSWISWSIGWLETLPLLGKPIEMIDRFAEQVIKENQSLPRSDRSYSWLTNSDVLTSLFDVSPSTPNQHNHNTTLVSYHPLSSECQSVKEEVFQDRNLLTFILSFLPYESLGNARRVSKRFSQIIASNQLLKARILLGKAEYMLRFESIEKYDPYYFKCFDIVKRQVQIAIIDQTETNLIRVQDIFENAKKIAVNAKLKCPNDCKIDLS